MRKREKSRLMHRIWGSIRGEWWYHLLRQRMREKQVWGEKNKASILL